MDTHMSLKNENILQVLPHEEMYPKTDMVSRNTDIRKEM